MGFFTEQKIEYFRARIAFENTLGFDSKLYETEEYYEYCELNDEDILSPLQARTSQLPVLIEQARQGNTFAGREACEHIAFLFEEKEEASMPEDARQVVVSVFKALAEGCDAKEAALTKEGGKTNAFRTLKHRVVICFEIAECINGGLAERDAIQRIEQEHTNRDPSSTGPASGAFKKIWADREALWKRCGVPIDFSHLTHT